MILTNFELNKQILVKEAIFQIIVIKEEWSYIFVFFTNEYTLVALVLTGFSFVLLNSTSLLSSSVFLSEPESNWRKIKEGWGFVEFNKIFVIKEGESYIFLFFTNKYTLAALVFTWFSFVSLNSTSLLNSSVFLSEPATNWRKIKKTEVALKKRPRQNLVYSILKISASNKESLFCLYYKL